MRRLAAALVLAACAGTAAAQALLDFSAAERAAILAHGPWPQAVARDTSNRVERSAQAVRFGRQLFFDARLSVDGAVSCASCHLPQRAFQDGLVRSRGRDALTRNTPSLMDTAAQRWWGWDGASDSLWAASLTPLLDTREMGQRADALADRVRSTPRLAAAYRSTFGAPPGVDDERVVVDVAKALAAYQATLRSPRTPFDRFRDALARGDVAAAGTYPLDAQRGLRLFIGDARCSVCHAGPAFSNREFADVGVPFFTAAGVDGGRHAGLSALMASRMNRLGPHNDAAAHDSRADLTRHVVQQPRNFGEFKVPGLRQLLHTAPYMHDGSLATIEDVVRHYSALDEDRLHADGERILRRLNLTPQQASDLAAFLRSLSSAQ